MKYLIVKGSAIKGSEQDQIAGLNRMPLKLWERGSSRLRVEVDSLREFPA